MDSKKELGIKMLLVTLFTTSFMCTGLWMAGFLENESVSYTRYQQLVDTKNKEHRSENTDKKALQIEQDFETITPVTLTKNYSIEDKLSHDTKESVVIEQNLILQHPDRAEESVDYEQTIQEESIKGNAKVAAISTEEYKEIDIDYDLSILESQIDLSKYPTKKVLATGYTAGIESTGKQPGHPEYGITYSGVKVRRDLYSTIAADPKVFPLGTILYIPGYGYGVVADTGGAIKGNKIDLYFNQVKDVYELWGKQHLDVYIVQEGDGRVTEAMLDHLNHDESVLAYKSPN